MRTLPAYEHFLVLAFAQLTYRESLRDIETCLCALGAKLYHSGIARPTARTTLADANEKRNSRIFSDFAHGLNFLGCRKVRVQDLTIEQTGGDGIYLGTSENKSPNVNVVIRRVDCNDNHRQGISIISAEDLLIEDCLLRNTDGTDPKAGIDFEPNDPSDSLVNCVLRGCIAENNAGTGFQICPQSLSSRSKPISIYLKNCVSRNNKQHGIPCSSDQRQQNL